MIGYLPLILTDIAVRSFVRLVDDGLRYKYAKFLSLTLTLTSRKMQYYWYH